MFKGRAAVLTQSQEDLKKKERKKEDFRLVKFGDLC